MAWLGEVSGPVARQPCTLTVQRARHVACMHMPYNAAPYWTGGGDGAGGAWLLARTSTLGTCVHLPRI